MALLVSTLFYEHIGVQKGISVGNQNNAYASGSNDRYFSRQEFQCTATHSMFYAQLGQKSLSSGLERAPRWKD